jgi:hypothetical protein
MVENKLVALSYLTGESVLKKYGASFQSSGTVPSAALVSRKIKIGNTIYKYSKVDDAIFYNPLGIENSEAILERAVADLIYITGGRFRFENLSNLDWRKITEIGKIYNKKSVLENIKKLNAKFNALR